MTVEKLAIASDHAGFELKESIVAFLKDKGVALEDFGPKNSDRVDYPDYGISIAKAIQENKIDRGILICGTGVGMSIVVN